MRPSNPMVYPPPDAAATTTGFLDRRRLPPLELVHATVDSWVPGQDGPRGCHRHRVYHLVVVTSGHGSFLVDDATVPVEGPTLFCLSPDQPHSFARRLGDDTVYSEITFQPAECAAAPDWSTLIGSLVGNQVIIPSVSHLRPDIAQDLRLLIARMVEPTWAGHPQLGVLVQGFLSEALFAVWRCLVADTATAPDAMEHTRRWLTAHLDRSVSLEEIAAVAGCSRKHVGRAFKQRFGITPAAYHQRARLERAASLLRTTDHAVKRIAVWCGYDDVGYFTKRFRAQHGRPPAAYRQQALR